MPLPFIAMKALSFLPFGSLLKGGSMKIVLIGVAVAAVAFGVWKWKDNIKTAVFNQIYQEQAAQQLAEQKRQLELSERLMSQRETAVREAFEAREELQRLLSDARAGLRSGDFEAMPVPEVIIESLRIIEEAEKGREEPDDRDPGRPRERSTGNTVIDQWRERFLNRGEEE